jgi:hypothetical protein
MCYYIKSIQSFAEYVLLPTSIYISNTTTDTVTDITTNTTTDTTMDITKDTVTDTIIDINFYSQIKFVSKLNNICLFLGIHYNNREYSMYKMLYNTKTNVCNLESTIPAGTAILANTAYVNVIVLNNTVVYMSVGIETQNIFLKIASLNYNTLTFQSITLNTVSVSNNNLVIIPNTIQMPFNTYFALLQRTCH